MKGSAPETECITRTVFSVPLEMQCLGCQLEVWKEAHPGKPYKQLLIVWLITICSSLPMSSLFPYVYFMIRDLHVARRIEDIGIFVGFLGASLFVGRALTSIIWGIIADKYGRKPVLLISSIAVVIFNALFGLSVNYWMAVTTRLLLGILNGLNGTVKAYAVEICPDKHRAYGLSIFSTAWGVGLILGPVIGGFLAMPAENFPHLISKESFLGMFPYFLPNFFISVLAIFASVSCLWLPETLHTHHRKGQGDGPTEGSEGRNSSSFRSLLTNWPLMSSIIVYCVFSIHDMAYSEIIPLWAVSDRKHGGLSFTSRDIGIVLGISGFCVQLSQLLFYSSVERRFGPIKAARAAAILSIPILTTFPFISKLSGIRLFSMITCASMVKLVLSLTIITGTFVLQNNAVTQDQRGAANGLSMTMQSICKAIGPAAAGYLFSWAQKRLKASFLPGDQIIFFALIVVEFIGFLLTFKPFLTVNETALNATTPSTGQAIVVPDPDTNGPVQPDGATTAANQLMGNKPAANADTPGPDQTVGSGLHTATTGPSQLIGNQIQLGHTCPFPGQHRKIAM